MNRILLCALTMCLSAVMYGQAQPTAFDSFVSRIAKQYKVDIALSPELIPVVDSILDSGTRVTTIDDLLELLVHEEHLTYQILDGNKLMLRREETSLPTGGMATIEGTILDQQEKLPLAYAAVHVLNSTRGCQTDEHGHFSLVVTDTTSTVQIDYLGYAPVQRKISDFLQGPITIRMKIRETPLEAVTIIIPYKEVYQDPTTQSLNMKQFALISETQLLQWNGERLLTTLTSYTQYSSDEGIRIRGVEPLNSLFLMDELPVYNPYHYYNIFSPFNTNYFSSVKLYKNNIPVRYGGRIDGMIQLASEQDKQSDHWILESDLLLTSVETRLGLGDNFSLALGGRVSHTGLLKDDLRDTAVTNLKTQGRFLNDKEFETVQQPTFNFYDINAGLEGQVGATSHVYLNGYSSKDKLNTTTTAEFSDTLRNYEIVSVNQLYDSDDQWNNAGFSTGFTTNLTPKTSLSLDAFFSHYEKEESYISQYDEERKFMNHFEDHSMTNTGLLDSKLNTSGLKGAIKKDISSDANFQVGLDLNQYKTNVLAKENQSPYLSHTQKETETTLFGNYQFWMSHHFLFDLGTRLTHLNHPSKLYFLPNVMATYFMGEKVNVRMAYSKSLQALHELTIVNRFGDEMDALVLNDSKEGYPVLQSNKYMIGTGYSTSHFSLDAEFYYKKIDGLMRVTTLQPDPGFNDHSPPGNFYKLFTGNGWTYGMDLTAYYKKGKTDLVASYTLSKIKEQYDDFFNGEEFSPQEDRRHQVKFSGRYQLGHFDLSSSVTYKSKAPYLSYIKVEDNDHQHGHHGIQMAEQEAVFDSIPAFFSLDFGVDYSFKFMKQHALVGISLINATDHANIEEIVNIGRVTKDDDNGLYLIQKTEFLGRTWNVRFRIMF